MPLANCKGCGKLMISRKMPYCPDCKTKQDLLYRQIRDYLKENPGSTLLDVHTNTGIPISTVIELRKEDYIPYS
ncbi:hypothetical protein [Paenibacillus thalictri]|uniref:Flagellar protein n=1 Tax=Paenibacillus thalictri TaxID=2527873 RepID=A0A4Q9DLX2_9BACL|nr:hypothetical protein [Paenibacillus thalictri]TBL74002.1 hypothetical protein EYB31_26270 [Paenibacillus thalictri]